MRGSTDNIMDDIERTVDDGINTYKSLTKDPRFVPGAGATEIELAKQLASYGEVRLYGGSLNWTGLRVLMDPGVGLHVSIYSIMMS